MIIWIFSTTVSKCILSEKGLFVEALVGVVKIRN